jgi:hypothetical protein
VDQHSTHHRRTALATPSQPQHLLAITRMVGLKVPVEVSTAVRSNPTGPCDSMCTHFVHTSCARRNLRFGISNRARQWECAQTPEDKERRRVYNKEYNGLPEAKKRKWERAQTPEAREKASARNSRPNRGGAPPLNECSFVFRYGCAIACPRPRSGNGSMRRHPKRERRQVRGTADQVARRRNG